MELFRPHNPLSLGTTSLQQIAVEGGGGVPNDAVSEWLFETDGTDTGSLANNMTLENGASVVSATLDLDGVDDRAALAERNDYSFIPATCVFTISAWMKLDDTGGYKQSGVIANSGAGLLDTGFVLRYAHEISEEKFIAFAWNNGDFTENVMTWDAAGVITTGWHLLTVVGDGVDVKLYLDNVERVSLSAVTGTPDASDGDLYIGEDLYGNNLAGFIDNVRIYNRTLDSDELLAIFTDGRS